MVEKNVLTLDSFLFTVLLNGFAFMVIGLIVSAKYPTSSASSVENTRYVTDCCFFANSTDCFFMNLSTSGFILHENSESNVDGIVCGM